jgi:glycosyltransferase involved in cell wall biosynthesis
MYNIIKNKTILIASLWGYPFGGGEEYLYQTAMWQNKINIKTYWICFNNAISNKPYENFSIEQITKNFIIIKIPDGLNKKILYNWIKILNPDLVHHQGHYRKDFHDVCALLRIPFLTGIHFWSGIVNLSPEHKNIDIYENSDKHTTDPDFISLYESQYCNFYSVSKYVSDCVHKITGKAINNICYSGSAKSKCFVEYNDPKTNRYVTMINIHKYKGGELLLYLLKEIKDIPFMVIRTEPHSEELDKEIENLINARSDQSLYLERINDVKFIYSNTKIFLASSLVDETFCRTVNEAMMNGIPVITTGQGNIKYLVEGAGIILPLKTDSDIIKWKETIEEIYYDDNKINEISTNILEKYKEYSEEVCEKTFISTVKKTLILSKVNNIMILSPWCDQGLGIQSRNYYKILKQLGYNVFIFSIKPYNVSSTIELQKDPSEWVVEQGRIYYSPNDREKIKDIELLEFIKKYNIGKCIIPETCWFRIFEIAKLMRDNNVKCYAIPNIEIVRKDEIVKHKYFYKILCNNMLCQNIFNKYGITTTQYIGYGIIDNKITFKHKQHTDKLKFLFIGGMNAYSRKHILEICEGFALAYAQNNNIELTCTIQKTNMLEVSDKEKISVYLDHPGIKFIDTHLSYDNIINLYYDNNISIQVSKHEGLGLGFYEALATGTPIISLNTPPHNEIVIEGVNGWIIDCYYKKMTDNPNSFIESAYFEPQLLCNKILSIIENQDTLVSLSKTLLIDYNKRLSGNIFINKFADALN